MMKTILTGFLLRHGVECTLYHVDGQRWWRSAIRLTAFNMWF